MKILITGINGQVGHALMQQLTDHELIGITRKDCDLTKPDQIRQVIDQYQPDLIINPAAYTKVDQAEDEPELAFLINRDAPRVIAEKAREYHIPLIHFSTDYVFDGKKESAYLEDDLTNPLGVYGESKLLGEEAIEDVGGRFYIFRTSWLYSLENKNFFNTIKKLSFKEDSLEVVSDQYGIPTSTYFIAKCLSKLIPNLNENNVGIYHLVPDQKCSWYEFAKKIIENYNPNFNLENLLPISSTAYKSQVKRPKFSILDNNKIKKLFALDIKSWETYFDEI
jgi:dTDP-4-dehydrorhamnose reductase